MAEAYELRQSLDEIAFDVPETHPKVLSPGKAPGYRIGLSEDGSPVTVDELDAEEMAALWYHVEGKQNAFPVVKIQHALLVSSNGAVLRQRAVELKKNQNTDRVLLLREAMNHWARSLPFGDEKTWLRLGDKAKAWRDIFNPVPDRFIALPTMLGRFATLVDRKRQWLQELATRIIERLEQGHLANSKLAELLLIGKDGEPSKLCCFRRKWSFPPCGLS